MNRALDTTRTPPPAVRRLGDSIVEKTLAASPHAVVYKARSIERAWQVAVKRIVDPAYLAFLRGAVRARIPIDHPRIVPLLAHDLDGAVPHLVPYISGGSLRDLLREADRLPPRAAVRVAAAVLEALDVAHAAGAIHGDVSAGDVLLGWRTRALLLGGGTAREGREPALDVYLAEIGLGEGLVVGRAAPPRPADDLHAVGVLLHEMLTGAATPYRFAIRDVSPELSALIERATHPRPERRFASAQAMLHALRRLPELAPEGAASETPDAPAGRVARASASSDSVPAIARDRRDPSAWATLSIAGAPPVLALAAPPRVVLHRAGRPTEVVLRIDNRTARHHRVAVVRHPAWLRVAQRASRTVDRQLDLVLITTDTLPTPIATALADYREAPRLRGEVVVALERDGRAVTMPIEIVSTCDRRAAGLGLVLGLLPIVSLLIVAALAVRARILGRAADEDEPAAALRAARARDDRALIAAMAPTATLLHGFATMLLLALR